MSNQFSEVNLVKTSLSVQGLVKCLWFLLERDLTNLTLLGIGSLVNNATCACEASGRTNAPARSSCYHTLGESHLGATYSTEPLAL